MSAHLPSIAAGGDRLATLEALRDKLATDLNEADYPQIAPITAQFVKVLAEIDELKALQPAKKGTPLDEVDERRRRRAGP